MIYSAVEMHKNAHYSVPPKSGYRFWDKDTCRNNDLKHVN